MFIIVKNQAPRVEMTEFYNICIVARPVDDVLTLPVFFNLVAPSRQTGLMRFVNFLLLVINNNTVVCWSSVCKNLVLADKLYYIYPLDVSDTLCQTSKLICKSLCPNCLIFI